MKNFDKKYIGEILHYIGISFITGAISHGFFSEERSIITAILGIVIFIIGEFLSSEEKDKNYLKIASIGLAFSISIGMISGGLVHFLDSPLRSMFIIPIGIILSIIVFFIRENKSFEEFKSSISNILIFALSIIILTFGAYIFLPKDIYQNLNHHEENHNENNHHQENNISNENQDMINHCKMMPEMPGCEKYLSGKTTETNEVDPMKEHCKMMPDMPGCEKYLDKNYLNLEKSNLNNSVLLQNDEENIKKASETKIVELKNGDSYTMEITKVKKEIGNKEITMFAYNGSIPGPILKAKKGSEVTIKLVNNIKNLETTLHSHGIRLDDEFDGVPIDMMGKQKVLKFGESFEYKIKFPDVGVFWYHPHVKEELQQELGLYGNYLVTPEKTDYYSKVNTEKTLILDDILLNNDKVENFSDNFTNYVLMGRFGNVMMINGDSNYNLQAKKGETIRMYFTNVSNTRPYNISIKGAKMKLVGGDIGKYEKEQFIDNFLITPAERYTVEAYFENAGEYQILNTTPDKTYTLGKVIVSSEETKENFKKDFEILRTNKDVISDIDNFRKYFDKKIDKDVILTIGRKGTTGGMGGMGGHMMGANTNGIEFDDTMPQMNKNSNSNNLEWKIIDNETKKENMDINWQFKKGDIVKIKIFNDPKSMHPMQHPIHFHGQRFLVISNNGVKSDNLVWKDTALVKTGEYIEVLVDMSNPGDWMGHCHIAEHLMSGMMFHFSVKE